MKRGRLFGPLFARFAVCGVLLLSAGTGWAAVSNDYRNGVACNPATPSTALHYDQYGVRNESTTASAVVHCDLGITMSDSSMTTMAFYVRVWDAASSSKIACNFVVTESNGNAKWTSNTLYSTSSDGQTSETLSVETNVIKGYAYLRCTLPPKDAQTGASYISSVQRISY
jgi:hypothetical protein